MAGIPTHLHATLEAIENDLVAEADAMLGDAWQRLVEAVHSGEGLVSEDDDLAFNAEEGVLYLCAGDDELPPRAAKLLLTEHLDAETWAGDALLSDRLGDAFDGYLARLGAHLGRHYDQQPAADEGAVQGPILATDRDRSLTWSFGERRLSLQRGMRCGDGDAHYDLWLGVSTG